MKRHALRLQRGLTMVMVMLLMAAMLMGALAFARVTEVGTLVSANVANKESSFHAAEVGRGVAFAQLQALANKDVDSGGWYWAKLQPTNASTGVPTTINFATTPTVAGNVGRFTVTYAVERMCTEYTITDSSVQCLALHQPVDPLSKTGDAPDMRFPPAEYMKMGARQYRITVRVTDARNTQTWTQSLVTLD